MRKERSCALAKASGRSLSGVRPHTEACFATVTATIKIHHPSANHSLVLDRPLALRLHLTASLLLIIKSNMGSAFITEPVQVRKCQSALLDLPAELRDVIFDLIAHEVRYCEVPLTKEKGHNRTNNQLRAPTSACPASLTRLLLVSSQMHYEFTQALIRCAPQHLVSVWLYAPIETNPLVNRSVHPSYDLSTVRKVHIRADCSDNYGSDTVCELAWIKEILQGCKSLVHLALEFKASRLADTQSVKVQLVTIIESLPSVSRYAVKSYGIAGVYARRTPGHHWQGSEVVREDVLEYARIAPPDEWPAFYRAMGVSSWCTYAPIRD